jgi:PhnB protein
MARVSTYLNFMGNTEEAFAFYRSVFDTEFDGPIQYMGEVPADPKRPPLSEHEKGLVMHVSLPITSGHRLMGTDMLESMGHQLIVGNQVSIMLEPDTRQETQRLFERLAEGGHIEMPLRDMFWGDYFGSLVDKFGVSWMFDCSSKE